MHFRAENASNCICGLCWGAHHILSTPCCVCWEENRPEDEKKEEGKRIERKEHQPFS